MTVTPAGIREHIETDLGDVALQRLIDDAERDIESRHGVFSGRVDTLFANRHVRRIYPQRSVVTVTEIVEVIGETETTLAVDDYRVLMNGRIIERRNDGTNPRWTWGDRVEVTYDAVDETVRIDRVTIDLVKLAIAYSGYASQQGPEVGERVLDYRAEREKLLGSLASGGRLFA